MNFVKTSKKLIGEIENNDLYASDEGLLNDGFGATTHDRKNMFEIEDEDLRGATIDFGNDKKPKELPECKDTRIRRYARSCALVDSIT